MSAKSVVSVRFRSTNNGDNGNDGDSVSPVSAVSAVSATETGRNRTHGDWLVENHEAIRQLPLVSSPAPECVVVGCTRTVHTHGLCKAHYHRARRMFDPALRGTKSNREENE